ncbi:MAG: methyltransferase domain-containing protein [Deltaproteobacteria bacterium]|nr:methyltransferase domain-containing protein [Deltaproteobacteria bacterium]
MDSRDTSKFRRLPTYVYLEDAWSGRKAIELGCGEGHGARFLAQNGARTVLGVDSSPKLIDVARRRHRLRNLGFRAAEFGSLGLDEGIFDVACIPEGNLFLSNPHYLQEVRRVLKKDGVLLLAVARGSTPSEQAGVSEDVIARVSPLFGQVRLVGVSPFVGISLAEFSDQVNEVPDVDLDATLLPADGSDDDHVLQYVVVAGRAPGKRGFMVVQLPVREGTQLLFTDVIGDPKSALLPSGPDPVPVAEDLKSRLVEAEAEASCASKKAGELERELDTARASHAQKLEDLRQKLARAEELRSKTEIEAKQLRTSASEAEAEKKRVSEQSSKEIRRLTKVVEQLTDKLAEAVNIRNVSATQAQVEPSLPPESDGVELSRTKLLLREREAEILSLSADLQATSWQVGELQGKLCRAEGEWAVAPPAPKGQEAAELVAEAALKHEHSMRESRAEIEERDAYIDELRDELARAQQAVAETAVAEKRRAATASSLEKELRELRSRAARAEGEVLRLRGERVVGPDPAQVSRIAELEASVAEKTTAAEKAAARWKEAESKTNELWRKIGEMQREAETAREQAVENARAQRQAAQVALTRAMEEASKKLVSVRDEVIRTERERKELEKQAAELKEVVARKDVEREEELAKLRGSLAEKESELRVARDAVTSAEQALAARREADHPRVDGTRALARVDEIDELVRILDAGMREEELRLVALEDGLRALLVEAKKIPEPVPTDSELARARKQVDEVVDRLRSARDQALGRSALDVAAMLDRILAEATAASSRSDGRP